MKKKLTVFYLAAVLIVVYVCYATMVTEKSKDVYLEVSKNNTFTKEEIAVTDVDYTSAGFERVLDEADNKIDKLYY